MPERKTAVLNVRVRPEIKNALKTAAERETRSLSNMIEVMIQEYVRKAIGRKGKVMRVSRAG